MKKNFTTIEMEVEREDEFGNVIGVFNVIIEGELYQEAGDYPNPPIDEIDILSVADEEGGEYSLSPWEEERAREMLREEFEDEGDYYDYDRDYAY